MTVVMNKSSKTISVLTIFFILQIFSSYVTDAQVNIIKEIVPNCVFGVKSLSYVLYTRDLPLGKVIYTNNTRNIPINRNKTFIFFTHGFISEANTTNNYQLVRAILNKDDVNIISLDWADASCNSGISITDYLAYNSAVSNVPIVGEDMANFTIRLIHNYGLSLNTTTYIGHSLGAHVVSFACKTLQKYLHQTAFQVIGLDPAGPGYATNPCSQRICKSDANFVQVFHTSLLAGISKAVGDSDFYYNGGSFQPGCITTSCSHTRAIMLLTASVEAECFIGTMWQFGSDNIIPPEKCTEDLCATPGLTAWEEKARGTFYVKTNATYPFCT